MQTVIYPVTYKVTAGDAISSKSLSAGDSFTGKVAFAVPAGADLSKYRLLYAADYNSGKAELAWKGK